MFEVRVLGSRFEVLRSEFAGSYAETPMVLRQEFDSAHFSNGTDGAPLRNMGVHSFDELRAWQSARTFKLAIYRLIDSGTLAHDFKLRDQLRECAASAVSHIAEGYGRFYPADFARFVGLAKASIIEGQNHLIDAVDRGHITDETRAQHHDLARAALRDVTALIEYLQSPKAADNAKKVRAKRQARRTQNPEPRTANPEPEPENTN